MPYIKESDRLELATLRSVKTAGELNYLLTQTVLSYWSTKAANYQTINDIVGALESCKAEFQRRIVVPYEDLKILENGDVYPTPTNPNAGPGAVTLDRTYEKAVEETLIWLAKQRKPVEERTQIIDHLIGLRDAVDIGIAYHKEKI